jgi:hypothetical protein
LDEALRAELSETSRPTESIGRVAADAPLATAGTAVDLTSFGIPVIQAIGAALLRAAAAAPAGRQIAPFDVPTGAGARLRCVPNMSATDALLRQSLSGELQLLDTRVQVLQLHQEKLQLDALSVTAWPILIQRTLHDIDASRGMISERLDLMIDTFQHTRNG